MIHAAGPRRGGDGARSGRAVAPPAFRRLALAFAAAGLAAGALAGCGSRTGASSAWSDPHPLPQDTLVFATAEPGRHGGRFVIAVTTDPKTFNAIMSNEQSSNDVNRLMFAGLAEYDNATQSLYPLLAKSWEVSPDGLTWTWRLRRGARFSDGHPITADDVRFSFEVAYDSVLHPSIQDLIKVEGEPYEITAPDSYTVVFRAPAAQALMAAAVGSVRIMPRHVLEPAFRAGRFAAAYSLATPPESLVVSGAFRLKQFAAGEKIVLERNPWWLGVDERGRRLPYLDEVVFVVVPDQNAAAIKFQAGEVDALENVKPEDYATYIENAVRGNYTLHDLGPSLSTNFLWFNLNRGRAGEPKVGAAKHRWFASRDFRRAVSHAIDRQAIIRGPYHGEAVENWSAPTVGSRPWGAHGITGQGYDPAAANRLLDGLGWRDRDGDGVREDDRGVPIRFTIKTNSDNLVRVATMALIQDDLAQVGIACTPVPVDFNTLTTNLRQDFDYEAMLLGLGSASPPHPAMYANFVTSRGTTHYWHVRQTRPETAAEARLDALYERVIAAHEDSAQFTSWKEIVQVFNDECFVVWLPVQKIKVPVRNRFGNIHPTIVPHRILWNIDRVFVKDGEANA